MTGIALRFLACVVALPIAAWLLPGVHAATNLTAALAGLMLAGIYLVLRPIAKLILAAFNCLTLGVLGVLLDAALVLLAAALIPGFSVDTFWWALLTSVGVNVLREAVGRLAERE